MLISLSPKGTWLAVPSVELGNCQQDIINTFIRSQGSTLVWAWPLDFKSPREMNSQLTFVSFYSLGGAETLPCICVADRRVAVALASC